QAGVAMEISEANSPKGASNAIVIARVTDADIRRRAWTIRRPPNRTSSRSQESDAEGRKRLRLQRGKLSRYEGSSKRRFVRRTCPNPSTVGVARELQGGPAGAAWIQLWFRAASTRIVARARAPASSTTSIRKKPGESGWKMACCACRSLDAMRPD